MDRKQLTSDLQALVNQGIIKEKKVKKSIKTYAF